MIGEIMRAEQALFLRRRRQEINVAIGPRALPQPLGDLDQHRDPARIVDRPVADAVGPALGRADAEMRSEEHTSELQSLMRSSYAVFCLKKKKHTDNETTK